MHKVSKSLKETNDIARLLAEKILSIELRGATVVGLVGELGAGKTAFTKALAKCLGVKTKVDSPTFVIMRKYPLRKQKHKALLHYDAYRLKDEKDLLMLGWEKIVGNKDFLIVIEWPERVKKVLPRDTQYIHFAHNGGDSRIIKLRSRKK